MLSLEQLVNDLSDYLEGQQTNNNEESPPLCIDEGCEHYGTEHVCNVK